jgi:hypothetical protein
MPTAPCSTITDVIVGAEYEKSHLKCRINSQRMSDRENLPIELIWTLSYYFRNAPPTEKNKTKEASETRQPKMNLFTIFDACCWPSASKYLS